MTDLPPVSFTFPPCPAWCQTRHEDQILPDDMRMHSFSVLRHERSHHEGDPSGTTRWVWVDVVRNDVAFNSPDPSAGSVGVLHVLAESTGDDFLTIQEAWLYSAAIGRAAALAEMWGRS